MTSPDDLPRRRGKRANGEGSIYHRADGRWSVTMTVMTPAGHSTRVVKYAKSQRAALALKREMEAAAISGQPLRTSRLPTVKEYGESWITETLRLRVEMGLLSAATWNNYRDLWVKHIAPSLGQHRLNSLTPPMLRTWLSGVAKTPGRGDKPIAANTVRGIHATLRKALADAVSDGLLATNPMLVVRGPSVARGKTRFLTKDEALHLRKAVAKKPLEPLVLVLLGCGLRIGEALALRWGDIDTDKQHLTISRSMGDLPGEMTMTSQVRPRGVKATKTASSSASVPVPKFVLDALRKQRAIVAKQRLAALVWDEQDLVFPSSVGTPLDRNNVAKQWLLLRTEAGLPWLRLHDLRHSTATFLLAAGAPMKLVQEVLRHSRLATTADIYTHVLPEMKDEAARLLDEYLAPAKPRRKRPLQSTLQSNDGAGDSQDG